MGAGLGEDDENTTLWALDYGGSGNLGEGLAVSGHPKPSNEY